MSHSGNIVHSIAFWRAYQWIVQHDFKPDVGALFELPDEDLLTEICGSWMLDKKIPPAPLANAGSELLSAERVFSFEKITSADFTHLPGTIAFREWFDRFEEDGWEDDYVDAKLLLAEVRQKLFLGKSFPAGVWWLSKSRLSEDSPKLDPNNWIYIHFETFVEIDREAGIIRTFDFGYD